VFWLEGVVLFGGVFFVVFTFGRGGWFLRPDTWSFFYTADNPSFDCQSVLCFEIVQERLCPPAGGEEKERKRKKEAKEHR